MRIAVVDTVFNWPPRGGSSVDVYEVVRRLKRDHEVRLFVPDVPSRAPFSEVLEDPGFAVERVPLRRQRHFSCLEAPHRFRRCVERWRADRVFVTDGHYLKPYLVLALRHLRPVLRLYAYEGLCLVNHGTRFRDDSPCPHSFHDAGLSSMVRCQVCGWQHADDLRWREYLGSLVPLPSYRAVVRRAFRVADRIVVYNRMARDAIRPYSDRVSVVPSGVDADQFTPPIGPRPSGPLRILVAGRLSDEAKGFRLVQEACRRLAEQHESFELLVTGEPEWGMRPFVRPLGWLERNRLAQLTREADLCVVPSRWHEPFGIVALEAMASARPVIVTRVGGLQEIVDDGVDGFVVPPEDPAAMAARIRTLFEQPSLRARMGAAGRRKVLARYTWDRIYHDEYRALFSDD